MLRSFIAVAMALWLTLASVARAADLVVRAQDFFADHCVVCHDAGTKKGGLDLADLPWKPNDSETFNQWVEVFDKVDREKMPPLPRKRPDPAARVEFLKVLGAELRAANLDRQRTEGRVVLRRLNMDLGRQPPLVRKRLRYQDEESVQDDAKKTEKKTFRILPDAVVIFDDNSPTVLRRWIVQSRGRYRIRISGRAYQAAGRPVWLKLYSTLAATWATPTRTTRVTCRSCSRAAVSSTAGTWRSTRTRTAGCATCSSRCSSDSEWKPTSLGRVRGH